MQFTKKMGNPQNKLMVDTSELQFLCGCGRRTAVEIGTKAGARCKVGKRVLWSVGKVQKYLESITG